MTQDRDSFDAYRLVLLDNIADLKQTIERLSGEIRRLQIDVATLKVKAGAWGAVGGAIVGAVASRLFGAK